ncbi:MAG: DUF4426 domain-containing protein [Oceanobacter sp.]
MKALTTALMLLFAAVSWGEQKMVFGDYEVHYIALNTSFLTPEVSAAYNIPRSGKKGFFNISVLKKEKDQPLPGAVSAKVEGSFKNLIGQSIPLTFKEVRETGAIYYIADFEFEEDEVYRVSLDVTPEGFGKTFDVNFSQKMYED